MRIFTTAVLDWFDDGCCDVKYLDAWQNAPRTFSPDQAIDASWNTDHEEVILTHDKDGRLFQKAADLLMRYQFYPEAVLSSYSDCDLESDRWLQVGDRIIQRIHLARLFGNPILDVIGITEVSQVIDEPCRHGFTYVTVAPHVEQGAWSAAVTWQENGDLLLSLQAISRPVPQEPGRNHAFMRALQKKAHQAGIAHFKNQVLA